MDGSTIDFSISQLRMEKLAESPFKVSRMPRNFARDHEQLFRSHAGSLMRNSKHDLKPDLTLDELEKLKNDDLSTTVRSKRNLPMYQSVRLNYAP